MIRYGIAPIGWRNDDIPTIGQENTYQHILSEVALAGFEGTEVGGCFPENPQELNEERNLRNVAIAGQWFSSYIVKDGIEEVKKAFRKQCEYLQVVGADVIVVSEQSYSIQGKNVSVFNENPKLTKEEWDSFAQGLNILGSISKEYQLNLVYHHHLGTVVQSVKEIDQLLASTDPEFVHLLFDTGHLVAAGENPMEVLIKHINRIQHVHFKDVRPSVYETCKQEQKSFLDSFLAGMFTVPGDGSIDFESVYLFLLQHNYNGWIIVEAEQDPKIANPLFYAQLAKNYIDKLKEAKGDIVYGT